MAKKKNSSGPGRFLAGLGGFLLVVLLLFVVQAWQGKDPAPEAGYQKVTLTDLGNFEIKDTYAMPGPGDQAKSWPTPTPTIFPDSLLALNGKEVYIPGFMMPYDEDERGVLSFMLVRSVLICCFGQPPRLNEVVMCQMPQGEHAQFYNNVPVRVYGKLLVGEIREYGQVQALYRLQVEKVEALHNMDASMQKLPQGMKAPVIRP